MTERDLLAAITGALGMEAAEARPVSGGDVARSFRVQLDDGRTVFAKTLPDAPAGFFATEAIGLGWLRGSCAIGVPEVLAVSDDTALPGGAGLSAGAVLPSGTDLPDGSGFPADPDFSADTDFPVGTDLPDGPEFPAGDVTHGGSPGFLVLEWIHEDRGRGNDAHASRAYGSRAQSSTESDFGRDLAHLHSLPFECFGRPDRRSTGSRGLPNEVCDTWAEFFGSQRLQPLARLAFDAGALAPSAVADLEALATRLDDLGGSSESPSLLHGDLWAGNRLVDRLGRNWLIDPAAHGGHREFDLAMMRLFGGFGLACFESYAEVLPLDDGWAERVSLHQIAPLVVHAIKFGGSYIGAATEAINQYR